MRIAVCLKQVPGTTAVQVDPETGVLQRDGVDAKMNPFDLHALEAALRLKEVYGGTVRAVSMGPPQASAVIREAYWMGADEGLLISDRRCAGADVLATARALAQGLLLDGRPDLVICGQMTTDGDTAQVGPAVAEFLDLPHVTQVCAIEDLRDDRLVVRCDLGAVEQLVAISLPALITIDRHCNQPRLPSFRRKLASAERPIPVYGIDAFDQADPAAYGLDGSPTRVVRIFPPVHDRRQERWCGEGNELGARLGELLIVRRLVPEAITEGATR